MFMVFSTAEYMMYAPKAAKNTPGAALKDISPTPGSLNLPSLVTVEEI
jgi:hypothetical protein